ncbi:MAG TPA: AsmA-like C-terminal region-containing protein, partial [Burkholderiaceae bacterium]
SGPLAAPEAYRVAAGVDGFSMAAGAIPDGARSGRPGWRNAKVTLDANERGGRAHLALDGGSIELPGVFEEPVIGFDRFGADASWKIDPVRGAAQPPAITVALDDVRFANADAEGSLQLQWQTGPGPAPATPAAGASAPSMFGRGLRYPGTIALKGTLAHARADRLARYLPKPGLESTRSYIAAAFAGGDLDNVRFNVRGDLAGFPYQRLHDGDFRIDGRVRGTTLTYVPGAPQAGGARAPSPWPAFTQVAGEVVLDRGALEIHDASGRMGELQLHDVNGGVKNLYEQAALGLHGQVSGPMTDFLRYVAQSPVGGWLHNGLASTTATGSAELELGLNIPLQHGEQTTVNGVLTLPGNDVRLVAGAPVLADARARVAFTEKGVTVSGGHARALGGDVAFDGGTLADGALRFTAQGSVSAEGLRKAAEEPVLARLASHVDGQAGYKLVIGIAKGQTEFALTSPLAGLGLALPAPLNKPADATWPLTVSTTASLEEGRPRDTLRVALSQPQGTVLQAEVLRDRSGDAPRPIRAAYAVGAPLPPLQPGGVLMLRGPSFDGDAWLALWRGLASGPSSAPPPAAGQAAANDDMGISYVPSAAALKTPDFVIGGHHLTNVDVLLAQVVAAGDDVWRSNISSDQTKGVVEYRPETPTRGAQVFARLDRLALDAHDAEPEPAGAASAPAPAAEASQTNSVPALDIVVDNFELNARKLGKLEVAATTQTGGRDWRLTKLAITAPEARLSGSGRWSGAPSRHVSLDFDLELADSGAFLGRLGMGQVLKKGKGKLAGSVTWTGSPLALDYPSLQGRLRVQIDEGQFLKADAGAGRLLGVLSLQSLPRRFMLDFRDLFSEGFAFDNVTGDVVIDRGVASTKDLRMRSATAAVLMSGRADLKAETQDIDVIIVPEVNAGAASLAYAAINPVIGIGTFLAQLFLRNPLTEAGTREVHVTGTWSAPKVDEVEHKAAVAAAAAAASAARASEAAAAASAALAQPRTETP